MSVFKLSVAPGGYRRKHDDWIDAGYVVRAHGVHGALRAVFSHLAADTASGHGGNTAADSNAADWLATLRSMRLVHSGGRTQSVTLRALRAVCGGVLLTCVEIADRQAAQLWAGATLQLPRDALPSLQSGEAYIYELVGARAQSVRAQQLGTVQRILDNAGQALLVIAADDGQERLLPLAPETLYQFDRQTHTLIVRVPEGLWETS